MKVSIACCRLWVPAFTREALPRTCPACTSLEAAAARTPADALGDLPRIRRRAEDRPGDLLAGLALLVGGVGDLGGDQAHPGDRLADRRDGADRPIRGPLDRPDLPGDAVGGERGLAGQRLDLGGDHGEAAARRAGAGGLDRGVERQQVGLLGDRRGSA